MAKISKQKIKIGIIGCDSFHTPVLYEQFKKMKDIEVVWIDKTLRSNLSFSQKRQKRFERMLPRELLKEINLENHETVDGYCVLNVDASQHLKILQKLNKNIPIFVDKPLTYDIKELKAMKAWILSSGSALRYCNFLADVQISNRIEIEGPLSYIEDIPGYFWYGIHLVEILYSLIDEQFKINRLEIYEDQEIISGKSQNTEVILRGIKIGDPQFKVKTNNQSYALDNEDIMYRSLAQHIIGFFKSKDTNLDQTEKVLKTIMDINQLKKEKHESKSNI